MNPFIQFFVVPATKAPDTKQSVSALRAEVVKEQAKGRLLPQHFKQMQPTADSEQPKTNSSQKDSPQG